MTSAELWTLLSILIFVGLCTLAGCIFYAILWVKAYIADKEDEAIIVTKEEFFRD